MKTTDNFTCYNRHKPNKIKLIENFIRNNNDIEIIYDVGCNNGDISHFYQINYGKTVLGVDLSDKLRIPSDYNFKLLDIVKTDYIFFNDATFLFSIYHHILGKYSLDVADDIFFKLLLRTKYLFFDTGNLSENERKNTYWFHKQKTLFKNEEELLNHFNIKYDVIGNWDVGGGSRSIIIFHSENLDEKFIVIDTYKRKKGGKNQKFGLYNNSNTSKVSELYDGVIYHKLEYNGKFFFSKKHLNVDRQKKELNSIINVYNSDEFDKNNLIKFYGHSKKYGFIFEWIDDFKYIGKTKLKINNIHLVDVDIINVDGVEKYIDFER